MLDTAPLGLYVRQQAAETHFTNSYFASLLGVPPEEISSASWRQSLHPADCDGVMLALAKSIATGQSFEAEYQIVTQSGAVRWVLDRANPDRDEHGNIQLQGFLFDITDRKQAELSLKQSEQRLQAILDNAPLGLYVAGPQGCEFVNQYWLSLIGMKLEDVLGTGWLNMFVPEEREQAWHECEEAVRTGQDLEAIHQFVTWDGEQRWMLDRGTPILDEAGQFQFFQGFLVDVTERQRNEEAMQVLSQQLQQQNEELREASRVKSEFLTNISHELRTPLTSILGLSSVLLEEVYSSSATKQKEYLSVIHSSAGHLLSLIDNLLDLSKIEAGKLELTLETIDFTQLCQEAVQMIEVIASNKQQQVILNISDPGFPVRLDRQHVLQMLLNYLSNAVKFTPSGGTIELCVRLASHAELKEQSRVLGTVEPADTLLLLCVRDTGIGVPLEKQHLLFQLFQQVDGALNRKHSGTGLGLVLTRSLAELHAGTVSFSPASEGGSIFSIWLPVSASA